MKSMCVVAKPTLALVLLLLAMASPGISQTAADTRAEIQGTFGFVPQLFTALPEPAQAGAWETLRDLELNPTTAIPNKYKSLIGIAVAAQIPCEYCVYIDTRAAKVAGASDGEISEALGMAALTRMWSTVLNGMQIDMPGFEKDVEGILEFAAKQAESKPAMTTHVQVSDAASAYRDMEQSLGRVPGFMKQFPEVAIAGAWKEFKNLQMNPNTELSGKYKELIGLAVASQIPCDYCIHAHTDFAMANGATKKEIEESVAMASLVRHWSTLLNGSQQTLSSFKLEADRMLKAAGEASASQR